MAVVQFFFFVVPDLANKCSFETYLTVKCFYIKNDALWQTCVVGYSWQCVKHKELLFKKLSMNLIMFISLSYKHNICSGRLHISDVIQKVGSTKEYALPISNGLH